MVGIVTDDRRRVGAVLVDHDLLSNIVMTNGLAKEAQRRFTIPLGCQQEVHRGADLVGLAI
jgi:hypothetical protein